MQSTIDPKVIRYLWHGYELPVDLPEWLHRTGSAPYAEEAYRPEYAANLLNALFDRLVSQVKPPYVVPISGGWDSRIILAALRERTSDIVAVTLGRPGQLAYEGGKLVADAAGVRHVTVCLDDVTLDWQALCETAQKAPWTYMPDAYFIGQAYCRAAGADNTAAVWSGFLGDPLTGGHYHKSHQTEEAAKARRSFSERQRRMPTGWLPSDAKPSFQYPVTTPVCGHEVSEPEFLDFAVRQNGCIATIVLGAEWAGWTAFQGSSETGQPIIAPYADEEWASYWLGAPRHHHIGQKLYLEMAERRFPEMMSLPSKYSWGVSPSRKFAQRALRLQHGIRNRIHRRFPSFPVQSRLTENYLNFATALRQRGDYSSVMERAISVLKEREATPWLDLDSIWREHYRGKRDHSRGLQLLLGLAVNLEANG